MSGEGRRYLIEPQAGSFESSDSHSGKAEVRIKTEMSRFIDKKLIVMRSN